MEIFKGYQKVFGFYYDHYFPPNSIQAQTKQLEAEINRSELQLSAAAIDMSWLCSLSKERLGKISVKLEFQLALPQHRQLLGQYRLTIKRRCVNKYRDFNFWPSDKERGLTFTDRRRLNRLAAQVAHDFLAAHPLWLNGNQQALETLKTDIMLCVRGSVYSLLASKLSSNAAVLRNITYEMYCELAKQRSTNYRYRASALNLSDFLSALEDGNDNAIERIRALFPSAGNNPTIQQVPILRH